MSFIFLETVLKSEQISICLSVYSLINKNNILIFTKYFFINTILCFNLNNIIKFIAYK